MKACSRCKRAHSTPFKACESCRASNRAAVARRYSGVTKTSAQNVAGMRAWRDANPERSREARRRHEAKRRARVRGATVVSFTAEQLAARLSMYSGCWICGNPRWTEVDHVKPLSKGGPHMLANLRPACFDCNRNKAAEWPFSTTLSIRR